MQKPQPKNNRGSHRSIYSSSKCENCGASFKPFNQYCEYCGSERPYEYPDYNNFQYADYNPGFFATATGIAWKPDNE